MQNNVLVLGYFGYETNQIDGQTIKTREIYKLIYANSSLSISFFDTQLFQKSKLNIFKCIYEILIAKQIVYLPGQKNLKYIFPFVFILCKVLNKQIIYAVVGGWLAEFLCKSILHRFLLRRIKIILVESEELNKRLKKEMGINNVAVFPNFRIHNFVPHAQNITSTFRIVFMARITKEKGIEAVFNYASYIQEKYNNIDVKIDFFGPLFEIDKSYFFNQVDRYDFIEYKGLLDPSDIYRTLSLYDVLVLPTFYDGEGFPGSIIDAYISGIPVIASRWKQIPEFVENGITGFLFDLNNELQFYNYLSQLKENKSTLSAMKLNAYEKSKEYSSEAAWGILKHYLLENKKPY